LSSAVPAADQLVSAVEQNQDPNQLSPFGGNSTEDRTQPFGSSAEEPTEDQNLVSALEKLSVEEQSKAEAPSEDSARDQNLQLVSSDEPTRDQNQSSILAQGSTQDRSQRTSADERAKDQNPHLAFGEESRAEFQDLAPDGQDEEHDRKTASSSTSTQPQPLVSGAKQFEDEPSISREAANGGQRVSMDSCSCCEGGPKVGLFHSLFLTFRPWPKWPKF
jgi:hypothetical protein